MATSSGLRRWLITTLAFVLALCVAKEAIAQTSQDELSGWSEPYSLGRFWFPDIAVDGMGRVHVVWASNAPGYDVVLYANSWNGVAWSEPNDIMALDNSAGLSALRPTLSVGPDGRLHLVAQDSTIRYSSAPLDNPGSAADWLPPLALSTNQVAYFSKMVWTSDRVLHLLYTENVSDQVCSECFQLYHRKSSDGGKSWSVPQDISLLRLGVAKPQIVVDNQDNLYVVWEAGYGGGLGQLRDPSTVMYTASYDGGNTWGYPLEMDPSKPRTPLSMEKNIALGWDGQTTLLIVWQRIPEDTMHFRVSLDRGITWSPPAQVPGISGVWSVYQSRLDDYTLAADSAGRLHLVAAGRLLPDQKGMDLLHLIWDGSQWSRPDVIYHYTGDAPEWPRAVVGLGNRLHVVWFVRDGASLFRSDDNSQYRVMYAQRTLDAPALPAQPWPTPQPTATPTAAPLVEVTPTAVGVAPVLPLEDGPRVTVAALQTENDDLRRLVLSLTPEALLLAALVIVIRRRRA